MNEKILENLQMIEGEKEVNVFYACESGSRAWGFPSADSDYDVRFLYLHPVNRYLSINEKRDVIEVSLKGQLDINGWDLKKALVLFRKSNPPLLEWLNSPIVYQEKYTIVSELRELAKTYYSPTACVYHYWHMAQGNATEYIKGEKIKTKKYFNILRPIVAIKWIEQGYGVPPTSFVVTMDRVIPDGRLRDAINELITLKKAGTELDYGEQIPVISNFINTELDRLEQSQKQYKNNTAPSELLSDLFRRTLREVWGSW